MRVKELLGSDRPGHLFAATVTGLGILAIAYVIGSPWLAGVGLVTIGWEWLATPDVDYAEKRRPLTKICNVLQKKRTHPFIKLLQFTSALIWAMICWCWQPYGWLVPHRSKYSHSLTVGLPCRLLYVIAIAWVVCWLWFPAGLDWMMGDAIAVVSGSEAGAWLKLAMHSGFTLNALWAGLKGLLVLAAALLDVALTLGDRWSVILVGAAIGDFVHLTKDGYSLEKML